MMFPWHPECWVLVLHRSGTGGDRGHVMPVLLTANLLLVVPTTVQSSVHKPSLPGAPHWTHLRQAFPGWVRF